MALAMQVAGCSREAPDPALYDHRIAHPLSAEAVTAVLVVKVPPGELPHVDAVRVDAFAQDFVKRGEGQLDLAVAAPSEADVGRATAFGRNLIRHLVANGVATGRILARVVVGGDDVAPGTATLRFDQWASVVPECGNWHDNLVVDGNNVNSPNFGCSTQHNIGMMVANPRDLIRPADRDQRLGDVGDRVISRYRRGEQTKTYRIEYEGTGRQR